MNFQLGLPRKSGSPTSVVLLVLDVIKRMICSPVGATDNEQTTNKSA